MTPLERAARAIASLDYRRGIRDCERPNEPPVYTPTPWDSLPAKAQAESMEKARAVLEAIRDPSDDMVEVGGDYFDTAIPIEVEGLWKAMIDSALADG